MRFFFDLYDDLVVIDDAGIVLPDLSAARHQAAIIVADVAKQILPKHEAGKTITVKVRDEHDLEVMTVTLQYSVLRS